MLTPEESELLYELASRVSTNNFYIFDVSELSTGIDNYEASYLIALHEFFIKVYKAIHDLYIADITGCLDSEL